MEKIILGLDIGTQYCYSGFYDNNGNFISVVKNDNIEEDYGIPTDVCFNSGGSGSTIYDKLLFCYDADAARCPEDDYGREIDTSQYKFSFVGTSLKAFARSNLNYETSYLRMGDEKFQFSIVFEKFICEVANIIKKNLRKLFNNNYELAEIRLAYPDVKDAQPNNYKGKLKEKVAEAFNLKLDDVKLNEESVYSENFFRRIYNDKSSTRLSKFCTIDVGGGTTDFAFMEWDEKKGEYIPHYINSANFGGKYIDTVMYSCAGVENDEDIQASTKIKHKRWLFNISGESRFIENQEANRKSILDKFHDEINKSNSNYLSFLNKLEECGRIATVKSITRGRPIYILMGGSCVLPCVKEALKEKGVNEDEIEYFTDIAKGYGVTNANFLAMASAAYERKDINLHYVPPIKYSPENYIIPATKKITKEIDGKIVEKYEPNGAIIIATRGYVEEIRYYLRSDIARSICNELPIDFQLHDGDIQILENDISLDKDISEDEYKQFKKRNKIQKLSVNSWRGRKDAIAGTEERGVFIGTKYIPNESSDDIKLQVYLFDAVTGEPYIVEGQQEHIDYWEFAKRAEVKPQIRKPQTNTPTTIRKEEFNSVTNERKKIRDKIKNIFKRNK